MSENTVEDTYDEFLLQLRQMTEMSQRKKTGPAFHHRCGELQTRLFQQPEKMEVAL